MSNETKRYGKTIRRPEALPLETIVEDADGFELVRETDGWKLVDEDSPGLATDTLSFPLRVILERSGDRKARGQDRASRRERGRQKAKARAAKVLRQVHAAEEERERSRREALEDRDRARNGEEVGA